MFRTPAELKAIEANGHLLNVQSLALSVSNLTEGHVGAPQFVLAKQEYQDAGNYQRTQAAIAEHTKNLWLTQRTNDLTLIREQANDVAADVRLDAARSGLETAYATLMASLGEEAVPASMGQQSLAELAESIKKFGNPAAFRWKQKGGRQSMRHSWCIRGMVLVLLVAMVIIPSTGWSRAIKEGGCTTVRAWRRTGNRQRRPRRSYAQVQGRVSMLPYKEGQRFERDTRWCRSTVTSIRRRCNCRSG